MASRKDLADALAGVGGVSTTGASVPSLNLADILPKPQPKAEKPPELGGDINFLGPLGDVIDIIDTPRAAIASTIQEVVDVFQGEGFSPRDWWQQTSDNHLFGEILRDTGVDLPGPWEMVLGLGLDVAFDPLTYFAGAGVAARLARADEVVVALSKAAGAADKAGDAAKAKRLRDASGRVARTRSVLSAGKALDDIGISSGARLTVPGSGRLGRAVVERPLDRALGGALAASRDPKRVRQLSGQLLEAPDGFLARNEGLIVDAMAAMRRGDDSINAVLRGVPEAQRALVQRAAAMASRMPVESRVRLPWSTGLVSAVAAQPGRVMRYATQRHIVDSVDRALNYRQPIRKMKMSDDPDVVLAGVYLERASNLGEVAARTFASRQNVAAKRILAEAERLGVPEDDLLRASDRPWGSPEMPASVTAAGREFHQGLLDFWEGARLNFNEMVGGERVAEMVGDLYAARMLTPEGRGVLKGTDEVAVDGLFGSPLESRAYVSPSQYDRYVVQLGADEAAARFKKTFMGQPLQDVTDASGSIRDQMDRIGRMLMGDAYQELFSNDFVSVVQRYIGQMSQQARLGRVLAELEDAGVIVREGLRPELSDRLAATVARGGKTAAQRNRAAKAARVANRRRLRAEGGGTRAQRAAAVRAEEAIGIYEGEVDEILSELTALANAMDGQVGVSIRDTVVSGYADRLAEFGEQLSQIGFRVEQLRRAKDGLRASLELAGSPSDPELFAVLDATLVEVGDALAALNSGLAAGALQDFTVRAAQQVIDMLRPVVDRGTVYGGVRLHAAVPDVPSLRYVPREVNGWGNPDHRAVTDLFDSHGQTLRGRTGQIISPDDPRIPDTVFHVTVSGRAVDEGGVLRIGQSGGLGGDEWDRMVSFTTSREVAEQLRNAFELRRRVAVLADRGDRDGVRALLARESRRLGVEKLSRERARELADHLGYPKSRRPPEYEWEWRLYAGEGKYSYSEVFDGFLRARHTAGGPRDPLFFDGDDTLRQLAGKSAADIRVVEVPRANLGRSGAAITDFDTGSGFLDEIRVYGDVPVWGANDLARKGLAASSPSKSVTDWGRIYQRMVDVDDRLGASLITHEADAAFIEQAAAAVADEAAEVIRAIDQGVFVPPAGRTVAEHGDLLNRQLQATYDSIVYQRDQLNTLRETLRQQAATAAADVSTNVAEWNRLNLLLQDIKAYATGLSNDILEARESTRLGRRMSAAADPDDARRLLNDERARLGFVDAYNEALSNQLSGDWFQGYRGVNTGEVAELFQAAMESAARVNNPKEMGEFVKKYAAFVNWWKSQAVMTPGFVLRNGQGGVWINTQLAGVEMGMHSKVAAMARAATKAGNGDVAAGAAVLRDAGKTTTLDNVFGVGRRVSAREWGIFHHMVDSGIVTGGQAWSEVADASAELGRGGTWAPWSVQFKPARAVRSGNEKMEFVLRGALAFDAMANKGKSVDQAWDLVRKFHFDYSELTDAERRIKLVVPFMKWQKSVLPVLLESFGRNPKAWGRLQQVKGELELQSDSEGVVPDYFGESLGIRLPFKFQGSRVYALPDLPFKDLARYLKEPTSPVRTVAESMVPVVKMPVEIAFGKRVFHNIPFSGRYQQAPGSYAVVPGLMPLLGALGKAEKNSSGSWRMRDQDIYVLDQLLPVFGRLRRLFPNEESKQRRLLSTWLSTMTGTGLRVNDSTEVRNQLIREQRRLADDLRDVVDIEVREV